MCSPVSAEDYASGRVFLGNVLPSSPPRLTTPKLAASKGGKRSQSAVGQSGDNGDELSILGSCGEKRRMVLRTKDDAEGGVLKKPAGPKKYVR